MSARHWLVRHTLTGRELADVQFGLALLSDLYGSNGHHDARQLVDDLMTALDGRRIR